MFPWDASLAAMPLCHKMMMAYFVTEENAKQNSPLMQRYVLQIPIKIDINAECSLWKHIVIATWCWLNIRIDSPVVLWLMAVVSFIVLRGDVL